ncbi:alginate lyase family protein [Sulfitobacter aestuariivivens]|uniref:Alginate lyase family protein n=1 Tax=Sulfitobacter aestuariivivens TaxID=2766981 RepID=A0A927D6D8_9RHOB|nr:alginate lyase family protein [Sulfitobacter aestuariivivens]MBD3666060.1 alginate lyase family protein [Sulfitobacter aestuariivivens]
MSAECPEFAAPVIDLTFSSRYVAEDETRSEIDPESAEETEAALAPLDAFVARMTEQTDAALEANDLAAAACVVAELVHWAQADALSVLGTETVELTIGSRLAALALVAGQVAPAGTPEDLAEVHAWLVRRMEAQMTFWETAPDGAASGNLRAWAGLAGAAVAMVAHDPVMRGWAAWSISYVACTANADGSLPQEMGRGELALHYQLHAVAPLTVAAALLEQQGLSVAARCEDALDRIVSFTLEDVAAGGVASEALSGEPQTVSEGIDDLKDFQLAWVESWLRLRGDRKLEAAISERRPLKYSKLGGDQTRIWRGF